MAVWALADLHLSFGVPNKAMDVFGDVWVNHPKKIEKNWRAVVSDDDLVLIAGDISWAKHLEESFPDLEWIDSLPGTKVMIKGNHDYWWSAISKVRRILPPSIHLVQNDAFNWHDEVTVGGARLWDDYELDFDAVVDEVDVECIVPLTEKDLDPKRAEKIYSRELHRLEMSLRSLNPRAKMRVAMTHYPPIGPHLEETRASKLLERYRVDLCVFGHLHSMKKGDDNLFGEKNGVRYVMSAGDYLDFHPIEIA